MADRRRRILESLASACERLDDAVRQPKTEFTRDAAIQRFEFTFELFWKALKADAQAQGLTVYSPKDSLRAAFRLGVIEDRPEWFRMLEDRNLASHTYSVETAEQIYSRAAVHAGLIRQTLQKLQTRAADDNPPSQSSP